MNRVFAQLWADEAGFLISTELMLVATILVIAMIVGLTEVRNAIIQELGDIAGSIGNINQTYSFSGVTGHASTIAGSIRTDARDYCDIPVDPVNTEPACMQVTVAPPGEI